MPWRHLRAIATLPGMVTLVVPALILYSTGRVNVGWTLAVPWSWIPPALGSGAIAAGILLMRSTISLFDRIGKGTLAPWDPTRELVVYGIYRHVRNPMISGVFCILLGEAILFGSPALLLWFLTFLLGNALYIPLLEEPGLERRFGSDYLRYKANVPRWIPRRTPWVDPAQADGVHPIS